MICSHCRVKMEYCEGAVSYWYCPKCEAIVDENDERFKFPSLIEKIEAKPICEFTRDENDES